MKVLNDKTFRARRHPAQPALPMAITTRRGRKRRPSRRLQTNPQYLMLAPGTHKAPPRTIPSSQHRDLSSRIGAAPRSCSTQTAVTCPSAYNLETRPLRPGREITPTAARAVAAVARNRSRPRLRSARERLVRLRKAAIRAARGKLGPRRWRRPVRIMKLEKIKIKNKGLVWFSDLTGWSVLYPAFTET